MESIIFRAYKWWAITLEIPPFFKRRKKK